GGAVHRARRRGAHACEEREMSDAQGSLAIAAEPARLVEVAIPVPLRRRFTYTVPPGAPEPAVGTRVAVPFSGRKVVGFVLGHPERPPEGVTKLKSIAGVLDPEPVFTPELLRFLLEAADYY